MADNLPIDVTVILCTFNRCERLTRTLESLATQNLPRGVRWEVLVVDNGSSDHTRRVIEECNRRLGVRFGYFFEGQRGKSHALNAGVERARGTVLAFTDDDVIAAPGWLETLTRAPRSGECSGASGRTLPGSEFSPPPWLPLQDRYALAPLALFDRGDKPGPLNEAPFGNNMAFRKDVFARYGGFRGDLGPQPGTGNPQKGEDSEFGQRILAAGEKLRYEAGAVIYHDVPANRVDRKYFLDWWHDKARADLRIAGLPQDRSWSIAGIPLYLFRRLVRWSLQLLFTRGPAPRFFCKIRIWSVLGTIRESFRIARQMGASEAMRNFS